MLGATARLWTTGTPDGARISSAVLVSLSTVHVTSVCSVSFFFIKNVGMNAQHACTRACVQVRGIAGERARAAGEGAGAREPSFARGRLHGTWSAAGAPCADGQQESHWRGSGSAPVAPASAGRRSWSRRRADHSHAQPHHLAPPPSPTGHLPAPSDRPPPLQVTLSLSRSLSRARSLSLSLTICTWRWRLAGRPQA